MTRRNRTVAAVAVMIVAAIALLALRPSKRSGEEGARERSEEREQLVAAPAGSVEARPPLRAGDVAGEASDESGAFHRATARYREHDLALLAEAGRLGLPRHESLDRLVALRDAGEDETALRAFISRDVPLAVRPAADRWLRRELGLAPAAPPALGGGGGPDPVAGVERAPHAPRAWSRRAPIRLPEGSLAEATARAAGE